MQNGLAQIYSIVQLMKDSKNKFPDHLMLANARMINSKIQEA
jgi:hypothetical protein